MHGSRQRSVMAGFGLLVLLVGAWWWFGASAVVEPAVPTPPSATQARGEVAPAGSGGAAAPASQAVEERLEVALPATPSGPTVVVRAVDAFGEPVEGAQVLVRGESDTVAQPFARTGADGTCTVALGAPVQFVRAHDQGVGTSIEVRVVTAAADDEPIVLPLLRPVVVRGRVVLRDEPVGAVRVQVRGELRLSRAEPGLVAPLHAIDVRWPDRSFTFEAAAGAILHLGAVDEQRALVTEQEVVAVDGLEVVLAAPGAPRRYEVHGLLLDADGLPLVGGPVAGFGGWSDSDSPVALVRAGSDYASVDANGRFTIAVDEPRVVVQGRSGSASSAKVVCEFAPERPRVEVVLRLRRNVTTKGKVVGDATDAGGVRVVEWGEDAGESFQIPLGENAEFQFDFPVGSRWSLSAGGDSVEVLAGQQDVVVVARAEPIAELRFEVVHADGRAPLLPWAEWWRIDGARIERIVEYLDFEAARVVVVGPRSAPWQLAVHDGAAAAHVAGEAGPRDLGRIFLQPPAKLTVRVRRAAATMRGLDVVVEGCGPPETSRGDAAGVHRFAQLSHGPAFVHVRRGAEVLATQRIELLPGQTSEVSFDLP